jgi:DNA polymerase III alpha subunit
MHLFYLMKADDTAKIYKYANELRSLGLKLLPPDINESDADFTAIRECRQIWVKRY